MQHKQQIRQEEMEKILWTWRGGKQKSRENGNVTNPCRQQINITPQCEKPSEKEVSVLFSLAFSLFNLLRWRLRWLCILNWKRPNRCGDDDGGGKSWKSTWITTTGDWCASANDAHDWDMSTPAKWKKKKELKEADRVWMHPKAQNNNQVSAIFCSTTQVKPAKRFRASTSARQTFTFAL